MFDFVPSSVAPVETEELLSQAWYIVSSNGQLLCLAGHPWQPLTPRFQQDISQAVLARHYLGELDQRPCYVVEMELAEWLPDGYEWTGLRSQMGLISDELFELAGRALQIVNWYNFHRYCGRCGGPTRPHHSERAMVCEPCQHEFYPRLSPCVIMVITRGDHCLLARNAKFPRAYYSALAGFIEAGETVESALHREVKEEVGITVSNLQYFGSQPWPFPGQLMLGFHAEYESGEIVVDGEEITDAQWWRFDQLPMVPPESTLSGRLIQHFVTKFT